MNFIVNDTLVKRFANKINFSSPRGCWEWDGARNSGGYGYFSVNGKQERATKVSYFLANGQFNNDLCVCHRCDNPSCVNPAHLFLGTKKDNTQDMLVKGRGANQNKGKTHCKNGHVLEGNIYISNKGHRTCILCKKIYQILNRERRNNWMRNYRAKRKSIRTKISK